MVHFFDTIPHFDNWTFKNYMAKNVNGTNALVILGISGGVDSSAAALLLKQGGYNVEAVFMQNWEEDEANAEGAGGGCSSSQDLHDAQKVCEQLSIPLNVVNFSNEYWYKVFQHFLDEYAAGRTPNPDVMCNKEIKFRAFLDYARQAGAAYIATGHYAQNILGDQRYKLLKSADNNKDQSYFLHTLTQEQLQYVLFPVGHLTKQEVRELAREAKLVNYDKKDSTGICFIGERKFKKFLSEYLLPRPGEIIAVDENIVIGVHDGIMFYTLGQRHGLGIGGKKWAEESPWYVVGKDSENNRLFVSQNHDHPMLLSDGLSCNQIHWISGVEPSLPLSCHAKIRYRQQDQKCTVTKRGDFHQVKFAVPQWAITPGQAVVFYAREECLGGGVIL